MRLHDAIPSEAKLSQVGRVLGGGGGGGWCGVGGWVGGCPCDDCPSDCLVMTLYQRLFLRGSPLTALCALFVCV